MVSSREKRSRSLRMLEGLEGGREDGVRKGGWVGEGDKGDVMSGKGNEGRKWEIEKERGTEKREKEKQGGNNEGKGIMGARNYGKKEL